MAGGTFTISNGGVFGSMLSTPIINPPQSAILGMHATQMRPAVVNGQVLARWAAAPYLGLLPCAARRPHIPGPATAPRARQPGATAASRLAPVLLLPAAGR
jgi:hypothetical protein